ncbi:DUF1127 domain-containing protein [Chelativorans salis]|uniref:DUF1127 domain-containing protein n=1 Tax=Chelativorans salis TaxID=2978478 RepID=A0ABT2LHY0_9HYPH|nr:DUF1127 domain-containing protein [Chelativorans sp. EGI FJ00035]MCT7374170.1 DUF1127 domain-containing protein [Chelativorans sp. EGI FJ00035]
MYKATVLRPPVAFSRGVSFLASSFRHIRRQLRLRRTIRDLESLPDHILHDIGLTQSEIASVLRLGPDDTTRRQRG